MTFNNDSSKFMKKKSLKESLVVIALSCKILINKLSKGILTSQKGPVAFGGVKIPGKAS